MSVSSHPLLRLASALPPHLKIFLAFSVLALVVSTLSFLFLLSFKLYGFCLRFNNSSRRARLLRQLDLSEDEAGGGKRKLVGFFHPYCNAGGGGERVLWTAVACLQREEKDVVCVVYTGDAVDVSKDAMIAKVQARFGIALDPRSLLFVPLRLRYLVEDGTWPRFTLLGQSVGSIFLALEGLQSGVIPDIWIDTMGYAFAYPFVRMLCKIPVGSYTHYPTISTDMLRRVQSRQAGHTNTSLVARSVILTYLKLSYYLIFAELYSLCLRQADVLMVNSTWTKGHVNRLLRPFGWRDDADDEDDPVPTTVPAAAAVSPKGMFRRRGTAVVAQPVPVVATVPRFKRATTVYPPCDTLTLAALPLELRSRIILSVAQFRPEKEHHVQLHALKAFFEAEPAFRTGERKVRLIMAGSVRNGGDEQRVEALRALAKELEVEENVEFAVNVPYPRLIELFGQASIGLHTMIDEHFGITVVEFMAAGLIPLVHASAGPLLDIVVPFEGLPTGFHASTAQTFADQLAGIMNLSEEAVIGIRERARRNAVERFSEAEFERGWGIGWRELVRLGEERGS